jgi:tetratricopeptide (TPR) repeat protein
MNAACEHEAVRRARSLEAHGFRRAAIDVLEAALIEEPDAGPLRRMRATLLDRDGRLAEAFAEIQRALALAPLAPAELLILAQGYARAGLTASAVDVYQQLAVGDSTPYELWPALFAGLATAERWQAALAVCRRAADERPDDDAVYYATAQTLARLGRPAGVVIGVLHKAIDLNPIDVRYRVLLATQLVRAGQLQSAYSCVAALAPEAFAELSCACCAWKLLRLCVTFGDAPRAAGCGAQLAHLSAAAKKAGHAVEDHQ